MTKIKTALLQLLSQKELVFVEYSRYLTFIEYNCIDSVGNVAEQYAQPISQAEPQRIDILITRQSGEAWSQVGELLSNAIDAVGGNIGCFGMGFKQVLQELKSTEDEVIVLTKSAENDYARVICFKKNAGNIIYFTDLQLSAEEFSDLFTYETPATSMTQIMVHRRLDSEDQEQIKAYVHRKYERCLYAKLLMNDNMINDFSALHDMDSTPIILSDDASAVNVFIDDSGYDVVDHGTGMTDEIIYRHFLKSRNSSKTTAAGGASLYYVPRDVHDKAPCQMRLMLSGIVIEKIELADQSLPKEVVLSFPQNTSISSSRQQINFDAPALEGLKDIIAGIFRSTITSSVLKISLINGLVSVLNEVTQSARVTETRSIHELKWLIRKGIDTILEPDRTYLPRVDGIEYLDSGDAHPIYLDPSIYPERLIEQFSFCNTINFFHPGVVIKKCFKAPFKSNIDPENHPLYLTLGSVLIINQSIYDAHCKTGFGRAALSQMLNVWIGSADDEGIPKDNGYFSEEDDPIESIANVGTEESAKDYFTAIEQAFFPGPPLAQESIIVLEVQNELKPTHDIQQSMMQTTYPHLDVHEVREANLQQAVLGTSDDRIEKFTALKEKIYSSIPARINTDDNDNRALIRLGTVLVNYIDKAVQLHICSEPLIKVLAKFYKRIVDDQNLQVYISTYFDQINSVMPKIVDANTLLLMTTNVIELMLFKQTNVNFFFSMSFAALELERPIVISSGTISPQQIQFVYEYIHSFGRIGANFDINIPRVISCMIQYGDFGLGEQFSHPLMLSALYIFGQSIDVLKPGLFLTADLLNDLSRVGPQIDSDVFWLAFWVFAIRKGIDLCTTPEMFASVMHRLFLLFKTDNLRPYFIEGYEDEFNFILVEKKGLYFDALKRQRSVEPLIKASHELVLKQVDFLQKFAESDLSDTNLSYLGRYLGLISSYGNLGLSAKQFNKNELHRFLSCVFDAHGFHALYKKGYLTAEWLNKFEIFSNETFAWWIKYYGVSFVNRFCLIKDKDTFDFITYNYQVMITNGIDLSHSMDLYVGHDNPVLNSKSNRLQPKDIECISLFLERARILFFDKKNIYINYFLNYGKFGFQSLQNPGLLWGVYLLEKTFVNWCEKGYFSPELLSVLEDKNEDSIQIFWLTFGQIAADLSQDNFEILYHRVYQLCFNSKHTLDELHEMSTFKSGFDFKAVKLIYHADESMNKLMSLLQDDSIRLPYSLSRIAEYFFAFGDKIPPVILEQRASRIGIATLGACFGWYAAQKCLLGESSLLSPFNSEKFNKKDATWIHRYWQFFGLIQPYLEPGFQQTIAFQRFIDRWLLICELEQDLPETLLGYLKDPHLVVKFMHNDMDENDSRFTQYLRLFHEERITPIEDRTGDCDVYYEPLVESLTHVSVAEIIVYRGGKNTSPNLTLADVKRGIQANRQTDMQVLVHEHEQVIRSVIASQPGADIWLRELIQNSHDALTKAKLEVRIDIEQYWYQNEMNNNLDFVVAIIDRAGMDLYVIMNNLLIPGSSDPEKVALKLFGLFGIGFFTSFTASDRLEIKTSIGGPTLYNMSITVKRNEQGKISLNVDYLYETQNLEGYKGTEIRRIKSYSENDFIKAQLEAFCLTSQINYFVGGLLAPVNTLSYGHEESLPTNKKAIIYYNNTRVKQPQREFLAKVFVQGLGFLNMYRQANVSTSRIEHSGLFVNVLGHPWTSLVPLVFLNEVGQGLVIELPSDAKLNSDRSGLCQEHAELIQKAIFVLYAQALLYLCFQTDHYIKMLPRDFFEQSDANYSATSQLDRDMRDAINLRLNLENPSWYGDWATDFPVSKIERYRDNRLFAVQLLTLIEQNQQLTLANVVSKLDDTTNACNLFKQRIANVRISEHKQKTTAKKIIDPEDWMRDQKILAFVIKAIHQKTGMGFSEIIYFEQDNDTVAYVQKSTGHLSDDGHDVVYPIHINVSTDLFSKRQACLLNRDLPHLIYDQNAANLIRTLAHETAHTEEFKKELHNGLCLIDSYRCRHPGVISDELACELRRELMLHFLSFGEHQFDLFVNLEVLASDEENPLPHELYRSLSSWASTLNSPEEGCCWTHNVDEQWKDSFVNMMKRVVNTWVEGQVFVHFDEIIDAAFAAYPEESLFAEDATAISPCVDGLREFSLFQPAPPLPLSLDEVFCAHRTLHNSLITNW